MLSLEELPHFLTGMQFSIMLWVSNRVLGGMYLPQLPKGDAQEHSKFLKVHEVSDIDSP